MKTKVARRHQITIPEEIRKKTGISVGDILGISYSGASTPYSRTWIQ